MGNYINSPSYQNFLERVNSNVLTNLSINNYFSLPEENKDGVAYLTLKLIKSSVKTRAKYSDDDIKIMLHHLRSRTELNENYELSDILKKISNNYQKIVEFVPPTKSKKSKIKKDIDE